MRNRFRFEYCDKDQNTLQKGHGTFETIGQAREFASNDLARLHMMNRDFSLVFVYELQDAISITQ